MSTDMKRAPQGGLSVQMVSEMTGYSPAQIALVARTVAVGADLQELAVFLHSTRALGLDPLLRQAYWIRRGNPPRGTLQVGIDGFRAIAETSGTYAGAEAIEFKGSIEWTYKGAKVIVPELARATVWKLVGGRKNAFVGEAYWHEFAPATEREAHMWAKMPRHMLGKVAEAQALRRAFPAQLGSLAMSADEPVDEVAEDPVAKRERLSRRYVEIYGTPDMKAPPPEDKALPDAQGDQPDEEVADDDD